MKICSVGADLFHADGRTDMTKLSVVHRNFANAPESKLEKCEAHRTKPADYRWSTAHMLYES